MTDEDDLRSAMRSGAGDAPDTDRVLRTARGVRAQRRVRVLGASGIAAVVASVGVGSALLARHDGASSASGSAHPASAGAAAGGASSGRVVPAAQPTTDPPGQRCPTSLGSPSTPDQPSGAAATSNRMFAEPVASIVVCGYATVARLAGHGRTPDPARLVLRGSPARQLAASIENAPPVRPRGMCSMIARADQHEIAIVALTADGRALPTVTTTVDEPACRTSVSNGRAVRYDWTPPASLQPALARLIPR